MVAFTNNYKSATKMRSSKVDLKSMGINLCQFVASEDSNKLTI